MKVLASDFDNTLYFKHGSHFKVEDIHRIKQFQQDGHLFGICSGRPFSGLLKSLEGILEPDFYIVSTGGAILNKDYQLLYGKKVPFDTICEIYLTYKNETELIVQTLSQNHFYCTKAEGREDTTIIHHIDEMTSEDIYSISLINSTEARATEITSQINQKYNDVQAFQNIDSIDIVAKGCSKGAAILKLKELFCLKKVAGIGDSYNDLSMLEITDTSFTFHQSPLIIQDTADFIVNNIKEAIDILDKQL